MIVGAGFGGLWATKGLAKSDVSVTLVDRNNYHSFFPLLYQVAAAELQPADICYPIRTIIRRQSNAEFRLGTVIDVDLAGRTVELKDGRLVYDYLILAPGSITRYFGVPGADEHSFGLRTVDDALELRNHLLTRFESASASPDPAVRRRLLTFAIVGGGPTGVEFAGALQEFLNGPFAKDFEPLVGTPARVVIIEGNDRVLSMYPPRLSRYAARRLARMGVEVRLGESVEAVTPQGVVTAEETVVCGTVVWTAGVGGDPGYRRWGLPQGPGQTIPVTPALNLDDHPEVFVVGDVAFNSATPTPMVAQNALQQGRHAAAGISRMLRGRHLEPFVYRDLGNMAVIGRNAAVVHLGNRVPLTGFVAWVIWLAVHLAKLIGFRNRLAALVSWTGDYFFSDRVARLIIPNDHAPPDKHQD